MNKRKLMPFPDHYRVWKENDYLQIILGNKTYDRQVTNAKPIFPFNTYETYIDSGITLASQLTMGVEKNYKDYNDLFRPPDDTLYAFLTAIQADVPIEVRINQPQSSQIGGINEHTDVAFTEDVSSKEYPTVVFYAFQKSWANFKLKNLTDTVNGTNAGMVRQWFTGMAYEVCDAEIPRGGRFSIVNMNAVTQPGALAKVPMPG